MLRRLRLALMVTTVALAVAAVPAGAAHADAGIDCVRVSSYQICIE